MILKRYALFSALLVSLVSVANAQRSVVEPIVNRPFTIAPAKAVYFQITVPTGAADITVEGRFEASGGMRNDVEVYILDEDAFVNWQNHHRVRAYYSSGRLTQGNIDASLPTGNATYYLVYSNKFSLLANKAVMTEVNLHYSR